MAILLVISLQGLLPPEHGRARYYGERGPALNAIKGCVAWDFQLTRHPADLNCGQHFTGRAIESEKAI